MKLEFYFSYLFLFGALLTTLDMIHDMMVNMIFLYKGQEERVKTIYIWIPSAFWTIFYLLCNL